MGTSDLTYGPSEFAKRDAIHVAIYPCVAGEDLNRGEHVTIQGGVARKSKESKAIGIVNPFYHSEVVPKGGRLWVFLRPNTIVGMRHHWEHPDIDVQAPEPDLQNSEIWLRHFANDIGLAYEDMMSVVTRWCDGGDEWVEIGSEHARTEFKKVKKEFWEHFTHLTGKKRPKGAFGNGPFSCAC